LSSVKLTQSGVRCRHRQVIQAFIEDDLQMQGATAD
jgi:hypothetical protein